MKYKYSIFNITASVFWEFQINKKTIQSHFFTICRIGRRYSFLIVISIFTLSTTSPIILRDFTSFSISRFIFGSVLNIFYQIPFIMGLYLFQFYHLKKFQTRNTNSELQIFFKAMEFVGPDHRTRVSSLSAIAYAIGGCILPGLAYLTRHWVWFSVAQLAITIPFFICWRFVCNSITLF